MASRKIRPAPRSTPPPASLAVAFERAPIGIALFEPSGDFPIIAANPALCDLLGYDEQTLIARSVARGPEARAQERELFRRVIAGTAPTYTIERPLHRSDGSAFNARLHVSAARTSRGIEHLVAFVEDAEETLGVRERYKAAAEAAFHSFSLMSPVRNERDEVVDFVLEFANARALESLQRPDAIGHRFTELVPPAIEKQLFEHFVKVIETGADVEGEASYTRRGRPSHLQYQIVRVGDGVALTTRDVTDQWRAHEALRISEERLAAIVGHAQDAIFVTDRVRRITWVSAAITPICGYEPANLIGTPWRDLVHPLDIAAFDEHVKWTNEHPGEAHRAEFRIRRADGHWIWTEDVAMNLDGHPAVNGLVAHMRDVTDRHAAEDALRASEERYRALVQNASDLVSVYDDHFDAIYISPSHATLLGHDPTELLVRPRGTFVHRDDVARLENALVLVAQQPRRTAVCHYRMRHADGSWRQLEAHLSNLLDDRAVRGIVVNARDVTEASQAIEALRDREEWYRALVQHSSDLVAVLDRDGGVVYLSPSHHNTLGHSLAAMAQEPQRFAHRDDMPLAVEKFNEALQKPGLPIRLQQRLLHADGSWRFFETTFTNLLDDETVRGVIMNSRDITEPIVAVNALRESEERFATLVRYSSDVVLVTHRDGAVHYVSSAVSYVLGYTEHDFSRQQLASYIHPDDRPTWETHLEEVLEYAGREHTLELRLRHADGRWRWMEVHAVNLLDDRAVNGVVVHLHDISERRVAESELEHQALHDPLTGLPNRALVLDRLGRSLARAARTGRRTVVLFIDVDRFKVVNDSLGHAYGDDLLVSVAARLRAALRETDTVARLGGDEFVVLLEDLPHETIALEVGDKILEAMRRPFQLAGREFFVTASIGLAISTEGDSPESMVRDADAAMYVAKGRGRNRLEVFDEAIRVRVVRHLEVENDLHRALERKELRLDYQPAYHLSTNRIVGVEALLRWDHPRRGLVLPGEFISVAEETGLIHDIGRWIIDEGCRQIRDWRDRGYALRTVWVNLSARQLVSNELPAIVSDALKRFGLPEGVLGLELTESALIEEAEAAGSLLREIEQLGVRLAIDDFGTGYSSLLYLQRYHVDVLKIDRSFVSGLGANADDTAITSAVISLGHELGMEVSAEGVETPTQLDHLRDMGCDTACGYFLVRPSPPERVTELLDLV